MSAENDYKIKAKINNNDDTRLWRYSQSTDFEGLRSFIAATWKNEDFIAQYEDDEGDRITIASAQDLKDAFDFARSEKKKSLKIYVQNYVQQKRAERQQPKEPDNDSNDAPDSAPEPEQKQQFSSIREMAFDFLSNQKITTLLPEFFGAFISKLIEKGNDFKPEGILKMFEAEITKDQYVPITSHPLYLKYAALAIPYISNKIAFQQTLYPHFRPETIKNWVRQLIALLFQALQQTANSDGKCCAFKDVVIDIEYPAMTDTGKAIHFGVECDLCSTYPIIGDRYKCTICEDFDLCNQCEPKHDDHPLIKFKKSSKNHKNASFKGLTEIIQRLSGDDSKESQEMQEMQKEENVEDIDDGLMVDCICGAKLNCVRAKNAYKRSNTVYCDQCSKQYFNEMIFHCPNGYDAVHHQNGYDLCPQCADKKALNDKEREKEMEQNEDENADKKALSDKEREKEMEQNEDENVEEEEEEEEAFEFAAQLTQIKQIMALETTESDELIKGLLVEHKGDISRVVPLLLH